MQEITFGPTTSRSLLGSLTDFSFLARAEFITSRQETLDQIAGRPARTPLIAPFDGATPDDVTRRLFEME